MADIGHGALVLSLVAPLYAAFAFVFSERRGKPELQQRGKGALWAGGVGTTAASALLFYLLLSHNFQVRYVYEHTSTYLPTPYLLSAFWAGQEGSLLLWLWLLSLLTIIISFQEGKLLPYALAVLASLQSFLSLVLVAVSDPFATLPSRPDDGLGLNPLLENFWMIVHPPVIFLGYAGYAVPFAFAFAALAKGHLDGQWLQQARFWSALAWLLLGAGILMGAWWAYLELGWGGYWGWDPVENSSLLPWLVGTAFLHSALAQERRGSFKKWNFVLATCAFVLCLFATFVTRSGVIQSVHAFARSPLGFFFLGLILLLLGVSSGLLYHRRKELRGRNEPGDLLSREVAFLTGNLLLCAAAAVLFLGTVYPALSELAGGAQVALDASFYQRTVGPLILALLALLGLCPYLGWRRSAGKKLWRRLLPPLAFAFIAAGLLFGLGLTRPGVLLSGGLCAFVGGGRLLEIGQELRRHRAHPAAVWKARRRYGASLAHLSVALIAIGVIGEANFKSETLLSLRPGESVAFGGYELEYKDFTFADRSRPDKERYAARLNVYRDGRLVATLAPEKNFHRNIEQWVTEVALHRTLGEDLYVILGWLEEGGRAIFQITINPLIIWLWIGGGVFMAGGVLALGPGRVEETE